MSVCIHIYLYISICVYAYIYAYIYTYIYLLVHIYLCISLCVCVCISVRVCVYVYVFLHVCIHMCVYILSVRIHLYVQFNLFIFHTHTKLRRGIWQKTRHRRRVPQELPHLIAMARSTSSLAIQHAPRMSADAVVWTSFSSLARLTRMLWYVSTSVSFCCVLVCSWVCMKVY